MNNFQTLGYMRVVEALNSGEDIASILGKMADHRLASQRDADVFGGALRCAIDIYQKSKAAGITLPKMQLKSREQEKEFNQFMRLGDYGMTLELATLANQPLDQEKATDFGNKLGIICDVLHRQRKAIRWVFKERESTAKPEPQEIRIVSMPDRKTETAVHRDSSDEIVKTVQVETDIQWAKAS